MTHTAMEDWSANLDQALHQLARQKGEHLAGQIAPILFINLRCQRAQTYLQRHPGNQLSDYVNHVANHYEQWSGYLYQLQQEKSDAIWLPLWEKLTMWARCDLSRKTNGGSVGQAEDMAQEAVTALMTARFPYDTPFDPWARVILRNTCVAARKHHQEPGFPLEQPIEEATIKAMANIEEMVTTHQDLLWAIEAIPHEGRQRLILLRYFEGLSYIEISQIMKKSLSALYKLHFEAIQDLRDILLRK